MKPIRNSAKAVIVRDGMVLLTKNKDQDGYFYLFPGGGQEAGESLNAAVVRECLEEIGQRVTVGELLHVREYIGEHHEFTKWADIHQVEFYFRCALVSTVISGFNGSTPDPDQVGVEWIEITRLHEIRVYPQTLSGMMQAGANGPCYIGDVN